MVYQTPYLWYIEPPTHGILTPLPMVYQIPYLWYIEPSIYGISNALPMVFWTPYPWYIETPIHGILNSLPMVFWPPYHGISNPLSMVFWLPYPWYIEFPSFGRNEGVQLTMMGFKIQWRKITPGSNSIWYIGPGVDFSGGQNTIWHKYYILGKLTFNTY